MKIKFNFDDKLLLNRKVEIPTITIVVRAVFHENNKRYPQVYYLIKYTAKQKDLLPFYVTNNELKKVLY